LAGVLETPYRQTVAYAEYIGDRGRYGTHQGVKGLNLTECWQFSTTATRVASLSYEKLLEAKPLSDTDRRHSAELTDGGINRTLRLLYVTCTRARKSLALIAYTENPDAVAASA
jgi:DNA helicase-2/ATP-dependent DNA helicase PcrA